MILEDSFELSAPIDTVWAFLQDIPRVSACVPGVEALEAVAPDTYQGTLKVQVGPIKTGFGGQVTILEQAPPERLIALVEGRDRVSASRVKATFTATLIPSGEGTQVSYELDVTLRGRLAQFGTTVVKATARKMTLQFSECVQAALAASGEA